MDWVLGGIWVVGVITAYTKGWAYSAALIWPVIIAGRWLLLMTAWFLDVIRDWRHYRRYRL